jgi:hypothetical protein
MGQGLCEEKLCWALSRRGLLFDCRSFYNVLVCNEGTPFYWKNIWWIMVPLTVVFFAW